MEIKINTESIELHDGIKSYPVVYEKMLPQEIPMIIESKKSLLQEIDLADMLMNLDNAAELLYIAFCALHGKSMQADLDGLQMALLKLCGQSKITMTTFKDQSKEITLEILRSYKFMKKGMVGPAKIIFESTANYARNMAEQSHTLSKQFDDLANQTGEVLKKVEIEHGNEIQNKKIIEEELQTMKAEKSKYDSLTKSLAEDLIGINNEYQEEKQALKSSEKKEMAMAITSMITSALSLGISAAISTKSGNQSTNPDNKQIESLSTEQTEKRNQQTKLNTDKQVAQKKLTELNIERIDLQNQLRTKKEQTKNKKDICEQESCVGVKETLQKEVTQLEQEVKDIEIKISQKQKEIDKMENSLKEYTSQLQGISTALKSITYSLQAIQTRAQSAVEEHSKKVSALLEKKLAMEKQKRESLAEMEKFALLIQGNNNKVITTDTAIKMLIVAIRCLKKVAASLITAAMFWQSLEQYCKKLSETTISKLLTSVEQYSKEERIEFFTDTDFVSAIIMYASQWAAMYYVSDEYLEAANRTYKHSSDNFKSMPNASEAMQIAQERSTTILAGISKQQHESTINTKALEKQIEELGLCK